MTKKLIYLLVIGALMAAFVASGASAKSQAVLDPGTKFYVPKVNKGATEQIADLTSSGNKADANLIKTNDPDSAGRLVHQRHAQDCHAGCPQHRRACRG